MSPTVTQRRSRSDKTASNGGGDGAPRRAPARRVEHLSMDERAAAGKAARSEVGREVHGEWKPAADRADPVDLLEAQGRTRVPELVPIRYGRMLVSPFTFYRGAAYLMASDLAGEPRTGLDVQLCGDAHLSNFGVFAAPDRRLVFSVNDFDETHPGPFEWDLKRLVASFEVAGRDRGFDAGRPARDRSRRRARLPRGDALLRRDADDGPLVHAPRRRRPGPDSPGRPRASSASGSRRTWRRRGPRTACGRWASSRRWSTASGGS